MSDRPVEERDAMKRIESGFEHVLFTSRWLLVTRLSPISETMAAQ